MLRSSNISSFIVLSFHCRDFANDFLIITHIIDTHNLVNSPNSLIHAKTNQVPIVMPSKDNAVAVVADLNRTQFCFFLLPLFLDFRMPNISSFLSILNIISRIEVHKQLDALNFSMIFHLLQWRIATKFV